MHPSIPNLTSARFVMFLRPIPHHVHHHAQRYLTTVSLSALPSHPGVSVLQLNRPQHLNSMNAAFFTEFEQAVKTVHVDDSIRALVITGAGDRAFSAGLDVTDVQHMEKILLLQDEKVDASTKAMKLKDMLTRYQRAFDVLEELPQPVIAVVHGQCLGSGMDLISACDVRFATKSAVFSIAEVLVGLAADLGTLQRLERMVSPSLAREWAFTGRKIDAHTALTSGLVSRVLENKEEAMKQAIELGSDIAKLSRIAVHGTKANLNYSRGRTVQDGLLYQQVWSSAHLQSNELKQCIANVRARIRKG